MTKVAVVPVQDTGAKGFLNWLKRYQPAIYARIGKKADAITLAGLGLTSPTDPATGASTAMMSSTVADRLKDLVTVAAQVYLTKEQMDANKKILDFQLSRAQQGLAPLDINPAQYGVPTPSVSVGMADDVKTYLKWGGLVGGGYLLLKALRIL